MVGEVAGKCRARSIFKELPLFERVLVGVICEETGDIFFIFVYFICFWQISIIRFSNVGERCQYLTGFIFLVKT